MTPLLRDRITTADLEWWLELAPTLTWTFAKTYAETAPHSYVVHGCTAGMTPDDYVRAAAVIRTFGQPAKYYDMTNIYLESSDGALKWWTMDKRVADVNLVNQATTDRTYGVQNAPSTHTGLWSDYDEIATDYDALQSPVDGDERVGLLRILADLYDVLGDRPTVLDLGCGTGAVLDLGVATPDRYTGIDSSQAMLNELLVKYDRKHLGEVLAGRAEDIVPSLQGWHFDLVIAAFGSASYIGEATLRAASMLASGATVLMSYAGDYRPQYSTSGSSSPETLPGQSIPRGQVSSELPLRLGKFGVEVIRA